MTFELLAAVPHHIQTIAQWYLDEWGYLDPSVTLEQEVDKLGKYLNTDEVPLLLVGVENDKPVAVAQLKFHEMDIYPDKTHWLGGVYVAESHRGKGIAGMMVAKVLEKAGHLDIDMLYLQTEDLTGGLYHRLGWRPVEQVNYKGVDVLVMQRKAGP